MDIKDLSPLLEMGAMGAIIALVTWLVRRVFTHTIPRLAEDFKESLKSQQALFMDQLGSQRDDFKQALSEQRTDFKEALQEEREQIGAKLDKLTEAVEALLNESRYAHKGP